MRMKNLLTMMLLAIGLLGANNAMAQIAPGTLSEICDWEYINGEEGLGNALFSWQTLPTGVVEIRIASHPDNAGGEYDYARFRDSGLKSYGEHPQGFALYDAQSNPLTFGSYFTVSVSSDWQAVLLTPVQSIPEGAVINFDGLIEYHTTSAGNALWPYITFPNYTYGTNCTGVYLSKLATPTDVMINENDVLTFTGDNNADTYTVTVMIEGNLIKTFNVSGSGETISVPVNGDFSVTVMALNSAGDYSSSNASEPVIWNPNIADNVVEFSNYCELTITGANSNPTISIETTEDNYIKVTLHDDTWRGGGIGIDGWRIAGINGSAILEKVIDGVASNEQIFRPKAGISIPKGTLISYVAGGSAVWEWMNAGGYINGGTPVSDYVYGTACTAPQLDTPSNIVLNADNTLTFDNVENADSYTVYILFGEVTLLTIPNFESGREIVFPINGAFALKVAAVTASSAYANSELSESIPLNVNIQDQPISDESLYCERTITGQRGSLSISVGTVNTDIEVTIHGDTWRNGGINVSGWTVAGISGLFDKISAGTDNPQIFRPKEGISIPKGTIIGYTNGVWEWTLEEGYINAGTTISDYVYGSTCAIAESTAFVIEADASATWAEYESSDFDDIIIKSTDASTGQLTGTLGTLKNNGVIKLEKTISTHDNGDKRWYAVGFPFDIVSIQCNLPKAEGVSLESGDDFWLRTVSSNGDFEALDNLVTTLVAGKGYAIQFPEALTGKVVTFISEEGVTLNNAGVADISASTTDAYEMVANPSVFNITTEGCKDETQHFYIFDGQVDFQHDHEAVKTIKPFESLIVYAEGSMAPARSISISGGGATGLINVSNDEIMEVRYYNLQGMEVVRPEVNNIYIVKTVFKSNKVETTKQIFK